MASESASTMASESASTMASESASTMASESASTTATSSTKSSMTITRLAKVYYGDRFIDDTKLTRSSLTSQIYRFEEDRLATISGWNHIMFLMRKKNKKDKKRMDLIIKSRKIANHMQKKRLPTSIGGGVHRSDLLDSDFESWCKTVVNLHTQEEVLALVKEDIETGNFDYKSLCGNKEKPDPHEIVSALWNYPTMNLCLT